MNFSELGKVIDTLSKERGVERSVVVEAIEQAFLVTSRKKYGIQGEYETRYNEDYDEIEIYQYKNVVGSDDVRDEIIEIDLNNAKKLNTDVEVGDQLGVKIENPQFSRVDIQMVKQIISTKVRDAEREILFSEFKHKEREIITGIARRYERGNIIVDLGKADAILPRREIISDEVFKTGDRIQAYLTEVVMTNRGPEIRLSRSSPMYMVKLFELEVPEIQDGTIEIKAAAREPGYRAKIAVYSEDKEIDPVGACVGMKGSRVQNIVNELQGEKIDIIRWSDDLETLTRAALAPAEISNIVFDQEARAMDIIIDEDQLALAIGRRGQNVRLASVLTGYRINIISKLKLQEKMKKAVEFFTKVPSITDAMAQIIVHSGVMDIKSFKELSATDISTIVNITEEEASKILSDFMVAIKDGTLVEEPESEENELVVAYSIPSYNGQVDHLKKKSEDYGDKESGKFSEAERRLREELAAFKLNK